MSLDASTYEVQTKKRLRDTIILMFISIFLVTYELEVNRISNTITSYCEKLDSLKCENGGIAEFTEENVFACSCPKGYYGEHCQEAKPVPFMTWISSAFRDSDVSRGGPNKWWSFIPFTSKLHLENVYSFHQNVLKGLETGFSGFGNDAYAARMLPRPSFCPNNKNLPTTNKLYTDIFERKQGQYTPDPKRRNLLYDAFYQYFVLQFFDSKSNLTVTASQLYGSDAKSERSLRSFSDGKLKTLMFNYKHYAVHSTEDVLRSNVHLKELVESMSTPLKSGSWLRNFIRKDKPKQAESPMLFAVSTLWVREHNRVCDMLVSRMKTWTDEQVYATARKIVTGQMMTIMMNEVMKMNTGRAYPLELKPELNRHYRVPTLSGSAIPIELVMTMTVSSASEQFENSKYVHSTFFGDSRRVLECGLKETLQFMVSQTTGKVTAHNDGVTTKPLTKALMKLSREHSLQGFNNYRRLFGLPAYNDFYELTGNKETAIQLESLYKTVDDVELLTGMLTERTVKGTLPTSTVMTNSFVINAIMSNHLTSEVMWKPDTFGGDDFFSLVKSADLKSFVCRNLGENCDGLNVGLYAE